MKITLVLVLLAICLGCVMIHQSEAHATTATTSASAATTAATTAATASTSASADTTTAASTTTTATATTVASASSGSTGNKVTHIKVMGTTQRPGREIKIVKNNGKEGCGCGCDCKCCKSGKSGKKFLLKEFLNLH
ncbi:protein new-glue 1-like [Drosophila subpulchrella]|uniref:protein new-glue 1-like n=1 Tax=Drosophila subpulchrella TaxID=1486046 RepID=UPI0018A19B47|nr:protein new-glue 1-like [Drosophila subpulchrella]